MALTQSSKKYWPPVKSVYDYLTNDVIAEDAKVLEIGPGNAPFKRANVYVDFVDITGLDVIKCDVATEPLPFEDKSFDFIVCRHCIEDMYNPFPLLREMSRVGKAGYIETPSPIAELGRGVDGGSPPFRGYHHHRFMTWPLGKDLRLISKYPFIEYLRFDEPKIDELLKQERYWNTYYLWSDEITFAHRQSPLHFDIPREYAHVLSEAMDLSRESTDAFFLNIK